MIINFKSKITGFLAGFVFIILLAAAANAQTLKGEWKLVEMVVGGARFDLTADQTPTLIFGEESRVSGNAGCNRYATNYELKRKTIDFKPFISTKMACIDDKRNSQEVKYFFAFDKVEKFKKSKKSLVFTDKAKKNVLKFVPLETASKTE